RAAARRRRGAPGIGDLGDRGAPLDYRVRRLSQPRAVERAPRNAARAGHPRLWPPTADADLAATVVQRTPAPSTREARGAPTGGRAILNRLLEDLSTLPPKRLGKELETLAQDALPCRTINVFDGTADQGLTV